MPQPSWWPFLCGKDGIGYAQRMNDPSADMDEIMQAVASLQGGIRDGAREELLRLWEHHRLDGSLLQCEGVRGWNHSVILNSMITCTA